VAVQAKVRGAAERRSRRNGIAPTNAIARSTREEHASQAPEPRSAPIARNNLSASSDRQPAQGDALGEAVTGGEALALGVGDVVEPIPDPPVVCAASCWACWTSFSA